MLPGDCVSSDHFECRVKGRFPHTIDKEDPDLMYRGGILFVDHASNYISVHHQVSRGERGEGGQIQYEVKNCMNKKLLNMEYT